MRTGRQRRLREERDLVGVALICIDGVEKMEKIGWLRTGEFLVQGQARVDG